MAQSSKQNRMGHHMNPSPLSLFVSGDTVPIEVYSIMYYWVSGFFLDMVGRVFVCWGLWLRLLGRRSVPISAIILNQKELFILLYFCCFVLIMMNNVDRWFSLKKKGSMLNQSKNNGMVDDVVVFCFSTLLLFFSSQQLPLLFYLF